MKTAGVLFDEPNCGDRVLSDRQNSAPDSDGSANNYSKTSLLLGAEQTLMLWIQVVLAVLGVVSSVLGGLRALLLLRLQLALRSRLRSDWQARKPRTGLGVLVGGVYSVASLLLGAS